MSEYTKRFVAYMVFLGVVVIAIWAGVVMTHDSPPPTEPEINYRFCVEHGGTYVENGIGEGFTCTLPTSIPPSPPS